MLVKVQASNFLSWKELTFQRPNGITLIDGWNEDDQTSEGSGKSSVLNAISWCLYGKLPKEANIDDVIRHGQKSCRVVLSFSDGIDIIRERKPNELVIVPKEGPVVKGKDARETQKFIEEYVGLSFDAFCQSVYFAQNNDKSFLRSNQEGRGKIISEIQDLNVFDRARKEVMSRLKVEEAQLTEMKHKIQMERKNLELVDNQILHEQQMKDQLKKQKDDKIQYVQSQVDSKQNELEFYDHEMKKIEDKIAQIQLPSDVTPLQTKLDSLKEQSLNVRNQITNAGSRKSEYDRLEAQGKRSANAYKDAELKIIDLTKFIENPTKNCPTCGSLLENCDTTHAHSEIEKLQTEMMLHLENMKATSNDMQQLELRDVSELQKESQRLQTEIQSTQQEINRVAQDEKNLLLYRTQLENSEKGRDKLLLEKQTLIQNLEQIKNEPIVFDDTNLQKCKVVKSEHEANIDSWVQILADKGLHVRRLESLKSGFKEIKSYVFNAVLNEINARVSRYLEALFETPVTLQFVNDNMKISAKATLNNQPQGIGLFSGGQTRRLSLAVDLALSDVVSSRKGNKLGILILDEYFKDLSEQSMQKCLELLESSNQPVIMIEHNSVFKNIVDDTFFVKYENGVSYSCH